MNELYNSDLPICQMSHTAPVVMKANVNVFFGKIIK